jgi:hypothetical protein
MFVGAKIAILKMGNAVARYSRGKVVPIEDRIVETEVLKVGRKYFYTKAYPDVKFYLSNWREKTDFGTCYKAFESKEAIIIDHKKGLMISELEKTFSYASSNNYTYSQLEEVFSILKINIDL